MDLELVFGFLILITIVFVIFFNIKNDEVKSEMFSIDIRKSAISKSRKIINKHKKKLAIQREKSIYKDSYGKAITTRWFDKEIPHFAEQHIFPLLNQMEWNNRHLFLLDIQDIIDDVAKKNYIETLKFNPKMNGFEFELFCADKLKKEGWNISKTKNGADQGIDLIIQKGKRKVGVQCKKYARPIGNKAVQEVKAGLDFYNLNEGIVIVNNSFTKSAIELAKSNKIGLFHYLETRSI